MIVLNIVLMTAVVVGIVSLLTWAIVSDRRSQRAAGGEVPPEVAPLHRNLELPHELRTYRGAARTRPARTRAGAARSTTA
jgi:hypothetical protein